MPLFGFREGLKSLARRVGLLKEEKAEEKVETEEKVERIHKPHEGMATRFICGRETCWCQHVNNSTLRLELVDAQILEAAYNRTLGKPIVSTPGKLVIHQLIERGGDVNAFDRAGITALHYSAKHLDVAQVKLLLQHKADPQIVDARGNSALHFAAMSASDWKPHADFMIKEPGKFDVICATCGHFHKKKMWKNGKAKKSEIKSPHGRGYDVVCELECILRELVKRLEKKSKKSTLFLNNLEQSAQKLLKDDIASFQKILNENKDKAINEEARKALEQGFTRAARLNDVVAKFFPETQ